MQEKPVPFMRKQQSLVFRNFQPVVLEPNSVDVREVEAPHFLGAT